jgi:hypothetical protein
MRVGLAAAGVMLAAFPATSWAACVRPGSNPEFWPQTTFSQYEACVKREADEAVRNPQGAIQNRALHNQIGNWVIGLGLKPLDRYNLGFITPHVQRLFNDASYSVEVRQGLQNQFDAFQASYNAAAANPNFDAAQGRALLADWQRLRASFVAMRDQTGVPAEKALLTRLIQNGDVLSDSVGLLRVAQTPGITQEQVRRIIAEELGVSNAQLEAKIRQIIEQMVTVGASDEVRTQPGETERQVRLIADYTTLGQSLVGVAAYAGILNQRDAVTMSRSIQGVSQIATAVTMMQGASGAALAGPYGMAIAGALTLAGAFAQQGPSEGAQIMSMLKALSRQIEHLQFTVEQGFSQLSTQISQSELRIMGRLGEILASQASVQQDLGDFRQEMASFRNEVLQDRYADHLARSAAFDAEIRYDDEECLRSFSILNRITRNECVTKYAALFRRFQTTENTRLVGTADPRVSGLLGAEDRISPIVQELRAKYPTLVPAANPHHRPTLDLFTQRLDVMRALNPSLRNNGEFRRLWERIEAARANNGRLAAAFAAPQLRAALRADYRAAFERVIGVMNERRQFYAENKVRTQADAVHRREVDLYNLPGAMHRRADDWTRSGRNRIYNFIAGDPADVSVIAAPTIAAALGPHRDFAQRITNYATIALQPVPLEAGIFPEAGLGPAWIRPCNEQSGHPWMPLNRALVSEALGEAVGALVSAEQGTLDMCYSPGFSVSDRFVAPSNSTEGFETIVTRMWAQGYARDRWGCLVRVDWGAYFAQTYGSQPEFALNDFEKCHGDHLHHKLTAAAPQARSVTVTVALNLRDYVSSSFQASVDLRYPNGLLDKCFLPFDDQGRNNDFNVLLPFRFTYPSPVRQPCASLEQMVRTGLTRLRPQVDAFLARTTRRAEPGATDLTFLQAAQAVSDSVGDSNLTAYIDAIMPTPPQASELNRLAALMAALQTLTADTVPVSEFRESFMNSDEIRLFLLNKIADRETNRLHDLDILKASAEVVESLGPVRTAG